ncbi:MAG: DUF2007 domain-containing protein [Planctomycetota bacterium]
MSQKQTVIYAAGTMQEAYLLKDVLAEAGIVAMVTNEVLEGGAGVDMVGWLTLARVVVSEDDAERARRIALYFEGAKHELPDDLTEETDLTDQIDDGAGQGGDSGLTLDAWPRCPECDAPRPTRCPVCGTIGSDFPRADPEFIGPVGEGEPTEATSCRCSSGGCSSGHAAGEEEPAEADEESPEEFDADELDEVGPVGLMLMCPTCDEPFAPEFPCRCAWCDHQFDDGYDVDQFHDEPPEEIGSRVLLVIFFLMALLLAVVAYFVAVL